MALRQWSISSVLISGSETRTLSNSRCHATICAIAIDDYQARPLGLPAVSRTRTRLLWAVLILAAFLLRLVFIYFLGGNLDGDSNGYLLLGRNLLMNKVYSIQSGPPLDPTFTRVPGYPLFIALVYFIKLDSLGAIRFAQAIIDTSTCVAVGMFASGWEWDEKRKKFASIVAFLLAAVCPFTLRYVPAILSETLSTFFAVALVTAASYALLAQTQRKAFAWRAIAGITGALGTLVRPDGGLFFAAVIATLIGVSSLKNLTLKTEGRSATNVSFSLAIALIAFIVTFAPWGIRNEIIFHRFIMLQPRHQPLPDGFVPNGYYNWLQTWVDDQAYVKPLRWELNYSPILLDQIPAKAFDSADERARVAELLDRYNHPQINSPPAAKVKITPQIDSGFSQIAAERRERNWLRFHFWLPAKRAAALWFDTHSDHYPFAGELFPLPGRTSFQNGSRSYSGYIMLWIFSALVWDYTLLGAIGAWRLWRARKTLSRSFAILVILIVFTRLVFFSTIDNPEPRFLVQVFPFLSALGGIALAPFVESIKHRRRRSS